MRTKPLLALFAASVGVLTALTAPAATAAESSAAVSCYGGAYAWDAGYEDPGSTYFIPAWDDAYDTTAGSTRVYRSSARCNDINLRIDNYNNTAYVLAKVCFYPSSGGRQCNSEKRFDVGDHAWRVIASDVRDGTKFEVEFDYNTPRFYGVIAH